MTPQERDLAIRIFVEYCARDVSKVENVGKATANAVELAKLSFELAAAFQKVDSKLSGERDPNEKKFEFDAGDIGNWKT
jgi:hypothetical protein